MYNRQSTSRESFLHSFISSILYHPHPSSFVTPDSYLLKSSKWEPCGVVLLGVGTWGRGTWDVVTYKTGKTKSPFWSSVPVTGVYKRYLSEHLSYRYRFSKIGWRMSLHPQCTNDTRTTTTTWKKSFRPKTTQASSLVFLVGAILYTVQRRWVKRS